MPTPLEDVVGAFGPRAALAWDTLHARPTEGICQWLLHVMDIPLIEQLAGAAPGDYARDPAAVYLAMQHRVGACFIDQFIPDNPLSMTGAGLADRSHGATTGAERIELDGLAIDSPEAAVEHMQRFVLPNLEQEIRLWRGGQAPAERVARLVGRECEVQRRFGPDLLKVPYGGGFQAFPRFRYGAYGYANYFMAVALFPEVIERDFSLQADLAELQNVAATRAIVEGGLPPIVRLDHDMTDSRGPLADIRLLDRIWLPHFARSIRPLLDGGVRCIWHCDGNVMPMVPRLIEAGVSGFQGFQYEDGVDYEAIGRMSDRDGRPLIIWAGLSVTRTLPFGSRQDVIDQLDWLARHGPRVGLVLGASSSILPNTNHENIRTMIEGLNHYRRHGRPRG